MVQREALVQYLDELLRPGTFTDYCPNGLQVEGRAEIQTLVSGVTASQALIEHARELEADALLVHHGYFWRGESPVITGMKARRLRALLGADLNLFAYHLPLDAHDEFGNNVQLAQVLELELTGFLDPERKEIGRIARMEPVRTAAEFATWLAAKLGHSVVHVGPEEEGRISTVGLCTGAGQNILEIATQCRLDAFVSGEISEQTTHMARECGVHYFGCGHHATERYGPSALGGHLAQVFSLHHHFVDVPNPA